MRLCEHPEFQQSILAAERHFQSRGLRAAIIEKDYYVTETLRCVAQLCGVARKHRPSNCTMAMGTAPPPQNATRRSKRLGDWSG